MAGSKKQRKPRKRKGSEAQSRKKQPKKGDGECRKDLIAALNHKLRRQMLRRLNGLEDPVSPAMLSQQMKVPLSNLSYHMDVLRKCCAVTMVAEQRVRGAVEHFYRSSVDDNQAVQAMLEEARAGDEKGPKKGKA